ncbi:DUF885 domain-containing protein [Alkalimonas collagenimarina]|uniref:DUF885 domain-containing protein n=1 Tax=Alkalimonas collagenimarina TaxID=400390 RepID=A0ABT9H163_9GAMM|nr:DUF885 domain-containing protein [Alkalimonas collagenimarina]MDP4537061.1 DUF885 domain-containing protein [Alkalimonas collagenimarina]
MRKVLLAWCLASIAALSSGVAISDGVTAPHEKEDTTSFHQRLDELSTLSINSDPELRSILGIVDDEIGNLSHQMTDVSLPRRAQLRNEWQQLLDIINAYDRQAQEGQERWSHDLAAWFYGVQIDLLAFDWAPAWVQVGSSVYAVDQLFSIPVSIPQFMQNHHAITSESDAQNYITRLEAIGQKLDQVLDNFDMQAEHGVIPPQVALEGAAGQIRTLLAPEAASSIFVAALQSKLDTVPSIEPERRQALLNEAEQAVREHTNPAYARLLTRLEQTLEKNPPNQGVWALPDGKEFYDTALRWNTSTDLDADTIHQIGHDEVARVEKQMDRLLRAEGLSEGSVGERVVQLAKDPRFAYEDSDKGRAEVIADIEAALDRLTPYIPHYFNRVPEQELQVSPVPEHAQATAPGGYYFPPALDGSRPGTFFINLGDIESNNRWSLPTLAYHEGAPGHHFQISLAQTLDDLPFLRRMLNPSPYTEGWALYAEQLVAEMGVYADDPLGDLGRLQAEMFRSVRLVVDTGLHRKRWTPEQAEAYMIEKTGMNPRDVRTEINRYLVQPGQATSYKIGHLKMLELREDAKARLGERFDIREFHDVVLSNGALPLLVLEQVVDEWVTALDAGKAR